jgi:uncharacterized membrane protein YjjB (DUF3815 family)
MGPTGQPEPEVTVSASEPPDEALTAELDLGAQLFIAGAPGQRIIDSISVLNEKLHGGHLHVLLGFEGLVIALEREGGRAMGMRQYSMPKAMNAEALVEISRFVTSLPDRPEPVSVIRGLRERVSPLPGITGVMLAGLILFTVLFGFFNHADAWALLVIGIAVLLAGLAREMTGRLGYGYYLAILAATLVATLSSGLLAQVIPTSTPLVSLIIPCIFLIPGFQLINGGWEVFREHLQIGIPRLFVFFNVLVIIAVGLLAVLMVYTPGADGPGLIFSPGSTLVIETVFGAVAAFSFCLLIRCPRQAFLVCILCGGIGRMVYTLIVLSGGYAPSAVFGGTLVLSGLALYLCGRWDLPVVIPLVAASVQFIPGYYSIISLQGMARIITLGESVPYEIITSTISTGLLALFIEVAIITGTLLPLLTLGKNRQWY